MYDLCVCAVKWVWHEAIKAACFSGKSSGPTWQRFGVQSRFFGTTISQQTDPRWQWVGGERFKWRTVPGSCMLFQRVCCGFIHILNVSFCWILAPHLMPYIELFLMDLGLSRTQDKILEDEMIKNLPWIWHPALTSNPPCHPSLRFATGRDVFLLFAQLDLSYPVLYIITSFVLVQWKFTTTNMSNTFTTILMCMLFTFLVAPSPRPAPSSIYVRHQFVEKSSHSWIQTPPKVNFGLISTESETLGETCSQVQDLEEPVQLLRLEKANQRSTEREGSVIPKIFTRGWKRSHQLWNKINHVNCAVVKRLSESGPSNWVARQFSLNQPLHCSSFCLMIFNLACRNRWIWCHRPSDPTWGCYDSGALR